MQPADLVILAGYPWLLLHWQNFSHACRLVIFATLASMLLSFSAGGEVLILAFYLLFPIPFMLTVYLAVQDSKTAWKFLEGFALGGGISMLLAAGQVLFGGHVLDFRTNSSFSLPWHFRSYAVFPEVSTFAAHLIYLFGIMLVLTRLGGPRLHFLHRPLPQKTAFFMALSAFLCLLLTQSTSLVVIWPAILLAGMLQSRHLSKRLLGTLALSFLAGLLVVTFLVSELEIRPLESAINSATFRGISMLAVFASLKGGAVLGVGLGNNHEISLYALTAAREYGRSFLTVPSGVGSFVLQRIFEEGYPGLLQFMLCLYLFVRAATYGIFSKGRPDLLSRVFLVLAFASLLISLLVTGYRGIYTNWLWMILPAAVLARQKLLKS